MAQRKHPEFTQDDLAKVTGKHRTHISKVMSGKREASLPVAVAIFNETGIKLGPLKNKTPAEIKTLASASQLLSGAA